MQLSAPEDAVGVQAEESAWELHHCSTCISLGLSEGRQSMAGLRAL